MDPSNALPAGAPVVTAMRVIPVVRNGAMAMQHLIPGWKCDNKQPCLVR